jgi:undecaprenyl-diphosphatase
MMRLLSGLADAALLLPAAAVLLIYLALSRRTAIVRIWAVTLAACGLATVGFKLIFHACGPSLTELDVVSPSGHASLATVFYGSLAILVGAGRPRWQKAVLGVAVLAFLLLVGVSRVRTGAHSPEEVVVGLAIGSLCTALFWVLHGRIGRPGVSPAPLAIGFVAAVLVLGGSHFSLEPLIGGAARRVSALLDVCRASGLAASDSVEGRRLLGAMLQIQPWSMQN